MRIIAGFARGFPILTPNTKIRPTTDRVRELLFAWLPDLAEARFLDLFAGSGSVGMEAVSRGACEIVLIEKDPGHMRFVKRNVERLSGAFEAVDAKIRTYRTDFKAALRRLVKNGERFHCIFLDPPFPTEFAAVALGFLAKNDLLTENGVVAVQWQKSNGLADRYGVLSQVRKKIMGNNILSIYKKETVV